MAFVDDNIPKIETVKPYTPLELQGRDLYVREGCLGCHSQMIRPMRFETERYGEYSKSGEFVYDHPFLWGSKRTGPDLAREGVGKLKKSDSWHYNHMYNPRNVYDQSIMPAYPWLITDDLDISSTPSKIKVLRQLGVPYEEGYEEIANDDLMKQAKKIAENLKAEGIQQEGLENKEIVALIAYLQRLGVDITAQAQAQK
jgi:cytochrome c oxidase cbb3-type subunit I/II